MPGVKGFGYRQGVPQQPYTKWDTDKDEVEVDYKSLEQKRASCFSGRKGLVLKILLCIVIFSLGLILGYVIRRSVHEILLGSACPYGNLNEVYFEQLRTDLRRFVDTKNMEENLKRYSQEIHLAGTAANNKLGNHLIEQLNLLPNVTVTTATYDVLLSYPDWTQPNVVSLLDENDEVVFSSQFNGPHPEEHPEYEPYAAYGASGTVEGELMYANYGEVSDFNHMTAENNKPNVSGRIVIMRYGRITAGEKVALAERYGASGVLLYSDPADVMDTHTTRQGTFPESWWLPPWAVRRSNVQRFQTGDPLSPGTPAKDGVYRLEEEQAGLPKIPVQPISYAQAEELMMFMKGRSGTQEFQGNMHGNVTYKIGPGYSTPRENWKVKLESYNQREVKEIRNILASIKGKEEPDRYVIIGAHYDAWVYGATDAGSGTTILMELAKACSNLTQMGWRPRRTIIFALWDAGEQGYHGSYEWVEEHGQELMTKTVAYINLDGAVRGNHTLSVTSSPMLSDLIQFNAHMVAPAVHDEEFPQDTLFDQWKRRNPNPDNNNEPKINKIGDPSDHSAFVYLLGVPVLWPTYVYDKSRLPKDEMNYPRYPAYHTSIDNFTYVTMFSDPDFSAHHTMALLVGDTVLSLSSSLDLAMDCRDLARTLEEEFDALKGSIIRDVGLNRKDTLDYLQYAIANFSSQASHFMQVYKSRHHDALELRQLNDQLMQVTRSFIYSPGLPGRPSYRNLLYAPSMIDFTETATFTGIRDAFSQYQEANGSEEQKTAIQEFDRQVSMATLAVQSASCILGEKVFL